MPNLIPLIVSMKQTVGLWFYLKMFLNLLLKCKKYQILINLFYRIWDYKDINMHLKIYPKNKIWIE